jgi:hypothetical protein
MESREEQPPKEREEGVILLRGFYAPELLACFSEAAHRCFAAIESGRPIPDHYRFTPQAHSVRLRALLDFGIETEEALMTPLSATGLGHMLSDLLGGPWRCRLEHSWVRKKFAPRNAPGRRDSIQDWHQDGALGAQFPPQPGSAIPITRLATCWIPLNACGVDSPGLEFIRESPQGLLHFSELADAVLRSRFEADAFWAPALELGDGLVFRNDVLHRTHADSAMTGDRISVEYRVFDAEP